MHTDTVFSLGQSRMVLVVSDAPGDTELEKLEKEARDEKKGLWADPASTCLGSIEKHSGVKRPGHQPASVDSDISWKLELLKAKEE